MAQKDNTITASFGSGRVNTLNIDLNYSETSSMHIDNFMLTDKVNAKDETKCFDTTKPAELTIYVEQSIEGSRKLTANIGHTFVGIKQEGIVRNLGFYPDSPRATLLANQDSEIHDNSGSKFHISITVSITASQLKKAIKAINGYPSKYDLNNYNCTDFGIEVAKKSGLDLPKTVGKYGIFFKGNNPSDLGEDIREMSDNGYIIINKTAGTAPARKGTC